MDLPSIQKKINRKLQSYLKSEGFEGDAEVTLQNLKMTDVPDDAFLTNVYLKKAEYEAKDDKENYRCFVCGKKYDHPDDFTNCFQSHLEDFMAGIPIKRTPEQLDRIVQNVPAGHRDQAKKVLKKHGL